MRENLLADAGRYEHQGQSRSQGVLSATNAQKLTQPDTQVRSFGADTGLGNLEWTSSISTI